MAALEACASSGQRAVASTTAVGELRRKGGGRATLSVAPFRLIARLALEEVVDFGVVLPPMAPGAAEVEAAAAAPAAPWDAEDAALAAAAPAPSLAVDAASRSSPSAAMRTDSGVDSSASDEHMADGVLLLSSWSPLPPLALVLAESEEAEESRSPTAFCCPDVLTRLAGIEAAVAFFTAALLTPVSLFLRLTAAARAPPRAGLAAEAAGAAAAAAEESAGEPVVASVAGEEDEAVSFPATGVLALPLPLPLPLLLVMLLATLLAGALAGEDDDAAAEEHDEAAEGGAGADAAITDEDAWVPPPPPALVIATVPGPAEEAGEATAPKGAAGDTTAAATAGEDTGALPAPPISRPAAVAATDGAVASMSLASSALAASR